MTETFRYDVFLSHSSQDKAVVRALADRLRMDGLRVWFDEWEIQPGDSIPAKIEEGLEHSRVLLLCMSANAFGSDWAQLESGTFRFRDPLNKERRFIPLRLDEAPIKGSLGPVRSTSHGSAKDREQEYPSLLEACRPARIPPTAEQEAIRAWLRGKVLSLGHTDSIHSVAFSADGKRAITGSYDHTVRVWDVESGACLRSLEGHSGAVNSVAFGGDGRRAALRLGRQDRAGLGRRVRRLPPFPRGPLRSRQERGGGAATAAARSPARTTTRCGSGTSSPAPASARSRATPGSSMSVAMSGDGRRALSGSYDNTVRVWDVESGAACAPSRATPVPSGAWGGRRRPPRVSGSSDHTVRVWDVESGACLRSLEGHSGPVWSVGWAATAAAPLRLVRPYGAGLGRRVRRVPPLPRGPLRSPSKCGGGAATAAARALRLIRQHGAGLGRRVRQLPPCPSRATPSAVWSVALGGDGRRALSGSIRPHGAGLGCRVRQLPPLPPGPLRQPS